MRRDGGCGCRADLRSGSGRPRVLSVSSGPFLVGKGYRTKVFAKMESDYGIANYCGAFFCRAFGGGAWGMGARRGSDRDAGAGGVSAGGESLGRLVGLDIQSRRFVGADRACTPAGGDTISQSAGEDVNLFQAGISDIHVGNGTLANVNAELMATRCGDRKARPR